MSRRRRLRPEEEELWQAVARTATPLKPPAKAAADPAPHAHIDNLPPSVAAKDPPPGRAPLASFRLGERVPQGPAPAPYAPPAPPPLHMDAKAFVRMTRGKLAPEARIDLHGLTLAEAQPELIRFILNAQGAGLRLVLVITGKGRTAPRHGPDIGPIPLRPGALRHQVPMWLRQPPMGQAVLQVAEAHARHGGGGAFYVYLRRRG